MLILPLLGVNAFERPRARPREGTILRLSAKGVQAEGIDGNDGFVVFKNSQAVKGVVASIHPYLVQRREDLLREKVLVSANGSYRFAHDSVFESPSMAAGVVLGRSANGRVEWRTADGKTLKEIQTEAVERSRATP